MSEFRLPEIRLICIPGNHGVDLPLVEAIALLAQVLEEPTLPEGWENVPALVLDDPLGGPPLAFYDADAVTFIPVCPDHVRMFRSSGRQS